MRFQAYLTDFVDHPVLQLRVLEVLEALPPDIQSDFTDDHRFQVTLEKIVPGKGWSMWMPVPGAIGEGSRCVVLRAKLDRMSEAFAKYIIAHEFAHAFLNNGGWGDITDPEDAADALAASWGFDRPAKFG